MNTCEYAGTPFTEPRTHPWTDSVGNAAFRYYDLTATPAHIRSSLEDFLPWQRYAAIEDFYCLLERVNQPGSLLETNDCAFTGLEANEHPAIEMALQCSGRVMFLFRELERNTVQGELEDLKNQLHFALHESDPNFQLGMIGTTLFPVRYLAHRGTGDKQLGLQLMISFWAWGDTEPDTMVNLQRLFKCLAQALDRLPLRKA